MELKQLINELRKSGTGETKLAKIAGLAGEFQTRAVFISACRDVLPLATVEKIEILLPEEKPTKPEKPSKEDAKEDTKTAGK